MEGQGVARLLAGDHVAELVEAREPRPVGLVEQVAAERIALARDGHLRVAGLQLGLAGGAARLDALDQQAVADGKAEELGDAGRDGDGADPEEGVLGACRSG